MIRYARASIPLLMALLTQAASVSIARAQDDVLRLMAEPVGYTDVLDAFDGDDPFDVNVTLGFERNANSGTIQREVVDFDAEDGRGTRHFVDVAEHDHVQNVLELGLAVGLFRDLMVFAHLPVVLAEERELTPAGTSRCPAGSAEPACTALQTPFPDGTAGPLFRLDPALVSGKRSGVPRVGLGIAWGVTNQYRNPAFATWVLRAEWEVDTGDVRNPCVSNGEGCEPGVSPGVDALRFESRWSYRFRYVEPVFGLGHTFQWISTGDALYRPAGALEGMQEDGPPGVTHLQLGAAIIPWEDRGRHQRLSVEMMGSAERIGAGRDISPLFDALGASDNAHLTASHVSDFANPAASQPLAFTGITRVEAFTRMRMRASLVVQAARYVRFTLGLGLGHELGHLITGEPACNTSVSVSPGDPRAGDCIRGIANPAHRPAIDAPGQRFRADGHTLFDLFASAAGQF
ncbi:MAG: hypothetical protein PVI30_07310 [Myxococcales bacterium]|jgi:hypothetical protein